MYRQFSRCISCQINFESTWNLGTAKKGRQSDDEVKLKPVELPGICVNGEDQQQENWAMGAG